MKHAFFAEPRTWSPVQSLLRWLAPALPHPDNAVGDMAGQRCSHQDAPLDPEGPVASRSQTAPRALRVVRVMEANQKPSQVGRMVISGSMADVCAELDRMVAREAALH